MAKGGKKIPHSQEHGINAASELPAWKVDLLDYPTFRITLIAKIMDRFTIRQLATLHDLSYAEWRVLVRLSAMPEGGTVGEIATQAWVDRAEVSRAAKMLEDRGWITRRSNPDDQRRPILLITEMGMRHFEKGMADRTRFHKDLLADLSPAECEIFDQLLLRIGNNLVEMVNAQQVDRPERTSLTNQ